MECLEFKRLALSDPNSKDISFVEHSETCPCCIKYVEGVREMDANLADSINVEVPSNLMAKLELSQLIVHEKQIISNVGWYSKVAGFAIIMFVSGFLLKGFLSTEQGPVTYSSLDGLHQASEEMVVNVIDHIEKEPMLPIWDAGLSNQTMKTLLASYDPSIKINEMENLLFIKVCEITHDYNGLHATLETSYGQASFAYIKGRPVGEVRDATYKGYMTRIKPIRNGSLIIMSQHMGAMEEAEVELESAIYWDI